MRVACRPPTNQVSSSEWRRTLIGRERGTAFRRRLSRVATFRRGRCGRRYKCSLQIWTNFIKSFQFIIYSTYIRAAFGRNGATFVVAPVVAAPDSASTTTSLAQATRSAIAALFIGFVVFASWRDFSLLLDRAVFIVGGDVR